MGNNTKPIEAVQAHIDIQHWASQMLNAKSSASPFTRITDTHPDLNLTTAYAIQKAYVELCTKQGAKISGFKAALTAPAAQNAMGIDTPIVGALFAEGHWQNDNGSAAVSLNQIPKLILETELGFTLNQGVSQTLETIEQMVPLIDSCQPMIELACLGFGDHAPTGGDLVASNSASRCYLQGASWDWSEEELDQLEVSLSRSGEMLHTTASGTVLGGQLSALLWLVNTTVSNGYQIEPGQILMTGSIGGLHPAQVGEHHATYAAAGGLSLAVS